MTVAGNKTMQAARDLVDLVTIRLTEQGSMHARGAAEFAVAAMLDNSEIAVRALGMRDEAECADRWVCCAHPLTDDERRDA